MVDEKQAATQTSDQAAQNRWKNAVALFGIFVLLPAFVRWQVPPADLDPWLLIGIAGIGGAIAGLVWRAEARLFGALAGALSGVGSLYAVHYYLGDRHEVFVAELLIPIAIGCLPGALVFFALQRMKSGPAAPRRPRSRKKIR